MCRSDARSVLRAHSDRCRAGIEPARRSCPENMQPRRLIQPSHAATQLACKRQNLQRSMHNQQPSFVLLNKRDSAAVSTPHFRGMALAQGRVPVAVSNVREHARVYPARTFSIVALGLISAMYFFQGSSLRTKPRTEITPVAVESLTLDAAAGDVIVSVGTRLKKRMGIRDALGFVALHFAPSGSPVAVGDVPANSGGASNVVVETSANAGAGVAPDTPTPTQSPGETTTPLPTTSPAITVTSSETVSPAGTASGSTSPAPVAAATVPPSISELISRHELFTPSTGRWRVAAATGFFGGPHPWSRGSIDCPGGCQIEWFSESERGHEDRNGADIR